MVTLCMPQVDVAYLLMMIGIDEFIIIFHHKDSACIFVGKGIGK